MANNKQYAKLIDIPDGNGSTERIWLMDEEAREELLTKATKNELDAMAIIPVDVSSLTPSTTFPKNSVIGINGVFYKARSATDHLPLELVVQDGAFVMQELGGIQVFIIADSTLNNAWMPWSDASIPAHLNDIDQRMATIETMDWTGRLAALEAATAPVTYNGQRYTLQQIMAEMAKLMDKSLIYQ